MTSHSPETAARRRLSLIQKLSLTDTLLLVLLVGCSLTGYRAGVKVLGPLHGLNFLVLVALAAEGALNRWWGWWFPAIIVALLGPLGALPGERRVRRQLDAQGTP